MPIFPTLRRVALLGLTIGVAACDVVDFANDPKPILEETWSLPATSTSIAVATLLPSTVTTVPDSSAFQMSLNPINATRRVGDDCAQCQTLNGTTAIKPAFVLNTGGSSALPTNIVGGSLAGATVSYTMNNALSFDPLKVNTVTQNPQGYMVIVIRSGANALGRDSVNGATTPWPPGQNLQRVITLGTGNITGPVTVDITLTSPASDQPQFINANGTVITSATISNFRVGSVQVNVPNTVVTSQASTLNLDGYDKSITDRVESATLEMTFDNPWPVSGNLNVSFTAPSTSIAKNVALPGATNPPAPQKRQVSLTKQDMQTLFGQSVVTGMSGGVVSAAPVTVTPKQKVSITNRLILQLRVGG
ncbi:MAG TPA: hypothetical protein VFT29_10420 [Gemmatimonadaceae bacterium]|nr:hypothetical protein [Gemmatimonadaceae bacterium]